MSDDALFDAFISGEDDLARRLQALAQPAPSAALDAAILASARAAMAQEARPAAANDSGDSTAAPQLAPSLGWRWRMPAGIAAAVLVGVFAKQAYEASADLHQGGAPAPAQSEAVMAPAPEATAPAPEATAPAPEATAPTPEVTARDDRRAAAPVLEPVPVPAQKPAAAAPRVKADMPSPPPPPTAVSESSVPAPAPAPAPAPPAKSAPPEMADKASIPALPLEEYARAAPRTPPVFNYSAAPAPMAKQEFKPSAPVTVSISGRRNRVDAAGADVARELARPVVAAPAAPAVAAPAAPTGVMAERDWLERIKNLLAQRRQAEAVADWKAFREVYPHYPVPEEIRSRLE